MKTTTFMLILITVLINGGATGYLLQWLDLKQQPEANDALAAPPSGRPSEGSPGELTSG